MGLRHTSSCPEEHREIMWGPEVRALQMMRMRMGSPASVPSGDRKAPDRVHQPVYESNDDTERVCDSSITQTFLRATSGLNHSPPP